MPARCGARVPHPPGSDPPETTQPYRKTLRARRWVVRRRSTVFVAVCGQLGSFRPLACPRTTHAGGAQGPPFFSASGYPFLYINPASKEARKVTAVISRTKR
jgi:hypothetical protein